MKGSASSRARGAKGRRRGRALHTYARAAPLSARTPVRPLWLVLFPALFDLCSLLARFPREIFFRDLAAARGLRGFVIAAASVRDLSLPKLDLKFKRGLGATTLTGAFRSRPEPAPCRRR